MTDRLLVALATSGVLFMATPPRADGAPVSCAELAKLTLAQTTVTTAEEISSGEFTVTAGPTQGAPRLANLPPFSGGRGGPTRRHPLASLPNTGDSGNGFDENLCPRRLARAHS